MAFSIANARAGPGAGAVSTMAQQPGPSQAQMGPDLEEIETDLLGFLAINGERKLQLLPTPWPVDALPPPTASLLTVASKRGLVAAAGQDVLLIASTDSIRDGFDRSPTSGNVVAYKSQLKIPMPFRVSQVAFSADESFLVISAEVGGGLAVYDVDRLMQDITETAFELGTDGVALRALYPNPAPDRAELFALVTSNGDLLVANLAQKQYVTGKNGQVLRRSVSCVSWSARGKQLVTGMADGTAYQMTPEGEGKAEIPKPPELADNQALMAIFWLQNDVFLTVHTPVTFDIDSPPSSDVHLVTRRPPSSYTFQKLADPCYPAGLNRSPPHRFIARLKDFLPNLQDALIMGSTASTDIGLLTRAKTALTDDMAAEKTVGVFTTTNIAIDPRRAQLPMTDEMGDTSPVGMAIDLSSRVKVSRPLMGDEVDQSPTPLPELLVLNNEGVLSAWWFVYTESIKQGTSYPGLVVTGGAEDRPPSSTVPSVSPAAGARQPSGFGAPSFGSPAAPTSGVGVPKALQAPASGANPTPPASTSAFGSAARLGSGQSPWGGPPPVTTSQQTGMSFGQPVFGSSSPLGAVTQGNAFGRAGMPGTRQSPWATAASGGTPAEKPSAAVPTSSPFGGGPAATPAPSGGFSSYASQGGFAAAAVSAATGPSIFGSPSPNPFARGRGTTDATSTFGRPQAAEDKDSRGPLGSGLGGFQLGSGFKGDGTAKDDAPKPATTSGNGFFGSGFGSTLEAAKDEASVPLSQETDMDTGDPGDMPQQPKVVPPSTDRAAEELVGKPTESPNDRRSEPAMKAPAETFGGSTTPSSSPLAVPPAPVHPVSPPKPGVGGTFATLSQADVTPASVEKSEPKTLAFEGFPDPSRVKFESGEGPSTPPAKARVHREDAQDVRTSPEEGSSPNTPLPPIPTSKASYAAGDSSTSSDNSVPDDAPLPPDFLPKKADSRPAGEDALNLAGPSSDDDGDWEGSGEDVAQDLSPVNEPDQTPGFTPQSSFGDALGGSFTNVSHPARPQPPRPLFGEIGSPLPTSVELPPRPAHGLRLPSPARPPLGRDPSPGKAGGTLASPEPDAKPDDSLAEQGSQPGPLAGKQAPEAQQNDDREWIEAEEKHAALRAQLQGDVEGTTRLPPFVAHHDYVGRLTGTGLGAEMERLYHDINSMVDTLGLNARALKAFAKGHTEAAKEGGRSRRDLDSEDQWCLVEIPDVCRIEEELVEQLDEGQVRGVPEKIRECVAIRDDVGKLRARYTLLRQAIDARLDPAHTAAVRAAPLNSEQTVQQQEIRTDLVRVQQLLSRAEEDVTVLRARLVSVKDARARPPPRMEAVLRTITKLTGMIEKKSGDVDMLENQLRTLRMVDDDDDGDDDDDDDDFESVDADTAADTTLGVSIYGTPQGRSSGNGSRAARSTAGTATRPGPGRGTYGLFFTPESSPSTSTSQRASLSQRTEAAPAPAGSSSVTRHASKHAINGGTTTAAAGTSSSLEHTRRRRHAAQQQHNRKRELSGKLSSLLSKIGPRVSSV